MLPPACLLYPGHDYRGLTVTSVAEERRYNPRFGGDSNVGDFVGYMNHLGLPHPKLLAIAVPANLRCGHPDADAGPPAEPGWAPLTWTFAGLWEIQPQVLEEVRQDCQVVDVREHAEFVGPLGRVPGAVSIPLAELPLRMAELDRTKPVVSVCRSGARSAQAVLMLGKAGFTQAANLAGGMLAWRAAGCTLDGGAA